MGDDGTGCDDASSDVIHVVVDVEVPLTRRNVLLSTAADDLYCFCK